MKIVLDTNVFVSSFFGGNPRKIINLWRDGKIWLCLSSEILQEYLEVVSRLGMRGKPQVEDMLYLFRKGHFIIFTSNPEKLKIVEKDPDDDKFFGCAISLNSEFIVSGDKAVLEIKEYLGLRVLSPKDFLTQFNVETP